MNSNITGWIPQNENMQKALDSVLDKGYHYGREWIVRKISDSLNDADAESKTRIQNQFLAIWDKLYHNWLSRVSRRFEFDKREELRYALLFRIPQTLLYLIKRDLNYIGHFQWTFPFLKFGILLEILQT